MCVFMEIFKGVWNVLSIPGIGNDIKYHFSFSFFFFALRASPCEVIIQINKYIMVGDIAIAI